MPPGASAHVCEPPVTTLVAGNPDVANTLTLAVSPDDDTSSALGPLLGPIVQIARAMPFASVLPASPTTDPPPDCTAHATATEGIGFSN
jgi:hypothetical protein